MTRVFHDRPPNSDELSFQFEHLATTLAALARLPENRTPFTVAVCGEWGSGKTTLLQATKSLLDTPATSGRKVATLWFNAWKYPSGDTVLAGLLGALIDDLSRGSFKEQFAIWAQSQQRNWMKYILKAGAPWLSFAFTEEGKVDRWQRARAFYDEFRSAFAQLLYIKRGGPASALRDLDHLKIEELLKDQECDAVLAIFIDDLDRAHESRVREVLEAINLFIDIPTVCVYLGLDWQRTVEIISGSDLIAAARTKDNPEARFGKAERVLEKIIQISLDIPPVGREEVRAYVTELSGGEDRLRAYLGNISQQALEAVYEVAAFDPRPRLIKRMLNDICVSMSLFRNSGKLPDGEAIRAEAVLLWLLIRAIDGRQWDALRRVRGNMDVFVRQWEQLSTSSRQGSIDGVRSKLDSPSRDLIARLHYYESLRRLTDSLVKLPLDEREALLYFRSPIQQVKLALPQSRDSVWSPKRILSSNDWLWVRRDEEPDGRRLLRCPVTNGMYKLFVDSAGGPVPEHWGGADVPEELVDHPVVDVTYNDAVAFAEWLTSTLNHAVRLPSRDEWTAFLCSNRTTTFPWGNNPPGPEHANLGDQSRGTTPVGSYALGQSSGGVVDLIGNVWEWCGAPGAVGTNDGGERVLIGGSFATASQSNIPLESLNEISSAPSIGFRVIQE